MYAVFQMAGFQYRVDEGEVIRVPSMTTNPGGKVEIKDVLLINDGATSKIGTPFVPGALVEVEVVEHAKADKVMSFKYRRRTKYRKTHGHRQPYTAIRINKIVSPKN
jgi:large subunit ribosomal protein L21